jgi:ABC-2 type transport system permease protein
MAAIATPPTSSSPLSDFGGILRSELCKLRSVRSTVWTVLTAVASNVALAALGAVFLPGALSTQEKATLDVPRLSLAGIHLSQIALGVLGVLVITSEYSSGMIRATFSAVPRRRLVLAAKAIVFAAAALAVGISSSFAAWFAFQAFLSDDSLRSAIGDPGVARAVTGGGLYLTVLGLLGLGLGAITRSGAGAIAALFGLLFVPPLLLQLLPQSWQTTVGPYTPMEGGSQIYIVRPHAASLAPWTGFGLFCLYAAVALGIGLWLINHRDA